MREKTQGKIYIIVGFYLTIINPISSLSFAISRIGAFVLYDPLSYWIEWLLMYGMLAIVLAVVGVYLIKIGYGVIKKSKKDLT